VKLTQVPFVDSFRVEVLAVKIKEMEHLFAQGATIKPCKNFVQRILVSKNIELDASVKCL